jgi:UrcA family protein
MQHRANTALLAGLVGLIVAGAASFTCAQPTINTDGTRSERVSYRDLNITEADGAGVLMNRIRHAAKDVCGPAQYDDMLGGGGRDYANCVRKSVQRAVAELNNPVVDALADPQHDKSRTKLATIGR